MRYLVNFHIQQKSTPDDNLQKQVRNADKPALLMTFPKFVMRFKREKLNVFFFFFLLNSVRISATKSSAV